MTIEAKEKHKQEKESVNKYYKPTRHISWIEIIPKYISNKHIIVFVILLLDRGVLDFNII